MPLDTAIISWEKYNIGDSTWKKDKMRIVNGFWKLLFIQMFKLTDAVEG